PSGTVGATLTVPISANTLRVNSSWTGGADTISNAGKTLMLNGLIGVGSGRTTISGTGKLVIGATKELVVNWTVGFSSVICPVTNNPAGASSVILNNALGSGGEFTWGGASPNTYSGGTTINSFGQLNVGVGAFGTGSVTMNGGSTIRPVDGSSSFANSFTINGGGIFRNNTAMTYSGAITINGSSLQFTSPGSSGATLSGNVSGTGGINANPPASATYLLSGTNTYTGSTTVSLGKLQAGRASVPDVSGAFGLNSAVTLANTANVILDLNGYNAQIGSLTGGGTTGGIATNSHATTAVTLTVGGNNTSPATFAGRILGPRLALRKIGSGTLTLSGANNYSNSTTVSAGTLSVSNSVFADGADVRLYTGSKLSLNYSGTDTIRSLYTNGVGLAAGEWGSVASGATNQSALFTGIGKLNVTTLGSTTFTNNISGAVTTNGVGLAGVTVSAGARSATTKSDGTYTIIGVLDGGTYTVTPSKYRYSFSPASDPVTLKGGDIAGKNFTATLLPPQGTVMLIF
ncbi:MAG: autotransporter-associated beta strand repeat-containing protein, partial [bacterium]